LLLRPLLEERLDQSCSDEWTQSDVDWTLLFDGQADPEHLHVAQEVATRLEKEDFTPPGEAESLEA